MHQVHRIPGMTTIRTVIQTCVMTGGLLLGQFAITINPLTAAEPDQEYYELMKLFVETFEKVDRNYVTKVDKRELMEAAMRGMLLKLDPYSSYIDNEELTQFNQVVDQEFGGIGIQVSVTVEDGLRQLVVMTPLPGTPAYKAGIRAGDRIIQINDKATKDFTPGQELESAVKLMKGLPGTPVTVVIQHEGAKQTESLEINRAIIKTPTVLGDTYAAEGKWNFFLQNEDHIGYIRLTHFSRNSAEEMLNAVVNLQKADLKGLIIDLRFNPGGLLPAATQIADLFVESGVIVSVKGRNREEEVVKARSAGTFSGFPVAVLVNRYSASASEILSACLQDHQVAVVVGERTWGKGSVQNMMDLEGGKSALKLTTASYHRPSGKNIHRFPNSKESDEWGVMPSPGYEVKFSPEEMRKSVEYRRERDVLRDQADTTPPNYEIDTQLGKAVTYIKEKLKAPTEKKETTEKKDAPDKKNVEKKDTVPEKTEKERS